jgi:large subunit ribosomal protein L25
LNNKLLYLKIIPFKFATLPDYTKEQVVELKKALTKNKQLLINPFLGGIMLLSTAKREAGKKGINKRLRKDGKVPAIIYSKGKEPQHIYVEQKDFDRVLREMESGFLPSTVFELSDEKENKIKAIVKDIDYNIITYNVQHLDFFELNDKVPVTLKVPITLEGVNDCAGVKEGGVLRQSIRHLKVECMPKDIPSHFTVCVKDIEMHKSKRLEDVVISDKVKPLVSLKEIAVLVAKR